MHTLDWSETDKLPDWSTYISPYDTSKRLGEEAVVSSNSDTFSTCALRAGGILVYSPKTILSTWPVALRGAMPYFPKSEPLDFMHIDDLTRVMVLAAQGLSERPAEIGGEAFFVTKG